MNDDVPTRRDTAVFRILRGLWTVRDVEFSEDDMQIP